MSPALPIERFAPVTLDELNAEAELLTRIDRKYLVPAAEAAEILDRLDPLSRVLTIDGRQIFAYDSVYFDTDDHLSYRLTAQRRRRRFKLRTRSYLDTGTAFLELKTKSGRGGTVKERMPYDPSDRATITPEGGAYLETLFGEHGHDPAIVRELRPALVSRYRRATLLLPCGSRATFDTRLHWSSAGGGIRLPRHVIVESKSHGRPSGLDRMLWRAGHRPTGISKFGAGTAALSPELPSNKWARTLRGPFASALRTPGASGAPGIPGAPNIRSLDPPASELAAIR